MITSPICTTLRHHTSSTARKMLSLLVLTTLLSSAHSLAVPNSHTIAPHEQIESIPTGWKHVGDVSKDSLLTLRAYLAQDTAHLTRTAEAVSDPSSDLYGKHLSARELAVSLPNTQNASNAVVRWINTHDVNDYQAYEQFVEFTTSVARAEVMLQTRFDSYAESQQTEAPVLRTKRYSLPDDVKQHIDFVYPTIHFFSSERKPSVNSLDRRQHIPTGPADCSNSVCPPQLRKQYNISYRLADNKSGSKIGIAGFIGNFPNITDVKNFLTQYGGVKNAAFPKYNVTSINKGTTKVPANNGALIVESNLDLDYTLAFTGPLDATFFSTGGTGTQLSQPGNKPVNPPGNEPYLEFLQSILAMECPPQVISISYSDDEQSVPAAYARRACDLFAQAAARGISIIVASGDGGASGSGGDTSCKGPDGKTRFVPTFPSSCPWVTSVGATAGFGGAAGFSSGGMSNLFARPSWQDKNVTAYIKALNGSHAGFYNKTGRGIPDVSLLGDDYLILSGGYPSSHDGTSASAPVFASMIALINDIRLRAKKPVLGFLNPLLYAAKAQSVYKDIADGSESTGCADSNSFETGWQALKGWDAATGLGEPDFQKLRALLA